MSQFTFFVPVRTSLTSFALPFEWTNKWMKDTRQKLKQMRENYQPRVIFALSLFISRPINFEVSIAEVNVLQYNTKTSSVNVNIIFFFFFDNWQNHEPNGGRWTDTHWVIFSVKIGFRWEPIKWKWSSRYPGLIASHTEMNYLLFGCSVNKCSGTLIGRKEIRALVNLFKNLCLLPGLLSGSANLKEKYAHLLRARTTSAYLLPTDSTSSRKITKASKPILSYHGLRISLCVPSTAARKFASESNRSSASTSERFN